MGATHCVFWVMLRFRAAGAPPGVLSSCHLVILSFSEEAKKRRLFGAKTGP